MYTCVCVSVIQTMSLGQDRVLVRARVQAVAVLAVANQGAVTQEVARILEANQTRTLRNPRKRMIKTTKSMEQR